MKLYKTDIADCNAHVQACPDNFLRAAFFVLATIQQQLETVPVAVSSFETSGNASRFAWGCKKRGIDYLNANFETLHTDAINCKTSPCELMAVFLRVPGLGLVKAGFLCQIFSGLVGCIDSHNIKLYKIPLSALRLTKKEKPETQARKIAEYVSLCDGLGGAVFLWSAWCNFVAALRPNNWDNGAAVSRFHFDVISGTETGAIVDLFTGIEYAPRFERAA